jgi:hypothetical protein
VKIGVAGNCQAAPLASCLARMTNSEVVTVSDDASLPALDSCDIVFAQRQWVEKVRRPVRLFPRLTFSGFHPDAIYIGRVGALVRSPLHHYNSSIAARAWLDGRSVAETKRLFIGPVFERVGFFEAFEHATHTLLAEGDACDFPLADLFNRLLSSGCFMHSMNHPTGWASEILAAALLSREGLPFTRLEDPDDPLGQSPIWPVYPEIAHRLSLPHSGDYSFLTDNWHGLRRALDLETFIAESFALYEKQKEEREFSSPAKLLGRAGRRRAASI